MRLEYYMTSFILKKFTSNLETISYVSFSINIIKVNLKYYDILNEIVSLNSPHEMPEKIQNEPYQILLLR